MFPGRDGRCDVGLAKEVQGELCLGQQVVPEEVGKESETPARMERKCALNVRMARLAMLRR